MKTFLAREIGGGVGRLEGQVEEDTALVGGLLLLAEVLSVGITRVEELAGLPDRVVEGGD